MNLSNEQISGLVGALKHTHDDEFNCEQFLDLMAEFMESEPAKIETCEKLKKVSNHLTLCAECREEYEMLKELQDECDEH